MKIGSFKLHTASVQKVKNLLDDEKKNIQGVYYTNSYFSNSPLARPHAVIKDVNVQEGSIKLQVSTRVEQRSLPEVDNTLEALVEYRAGDIPGFTPEGYLDGTNQSEEPVMADIVSPTKELFNIDILLDMKDVQVTYQEFRIAGTLFTLVNLYTAYGEKEFEQEVSLLFGESNVLYFFSNFHEDNLSVRDSKLILDLLMDGNILGKAIQSVKYSSVEGVTGSVFPYQELVEAYKSMDGDYIFGMGAGYVRIPKDEIGTFKMRLLLQGTSGSYQIMLYNNKNTIRIYME